MKVHPPSYGSQKVFYRDFYRESRGVLSKGLFSFLWKYPHKVLENGKDLTQQKIIVELGVGFGEHIDFVQRTWEKYIALDLELREPLIRLSQKIDGIELLQANATQTGLPDDFADRVIATCLIAHLQNPEESLIEWNRISKNGGIISIYLPCETGLALRVFRKLVSGRKARKQGFLGYNLFILREHINSYLLVRGLIKELFNSDQIKVRRRPFPWLSWYFNLFAIYEIRVQK